MCKIAAAERLACRACVNAGSSCTSALSSADEPLTLRLSNNVQVPKTALQTLFRGERLQPIAQQVLQLSKDGLQRRGRGEEKYLDPLLDIADSGVTLAERMLQHYNTDWGHSLDPLYADKYDY